MNQSTVIFLINKRARAIMATYEAETNAKRSLFKTLDESIAVDDLVIVQTDTRHKMTVCKVVEVDVDFDLDDATLQVNWIIGKVDKTAYEQLLAQEATAIRTVKSAELRQKREKLRDAMFADHLDAIKALPIADMNGNHTPAIEVKE